MNNVKVSVIETNENGVKWVELNGLDFGTNYQLKDVYGVTEDDRILDCDGSPLTEGDLQTVAVRNALENAEGTKMEITNIDKNGQFDIHNTDHVVFDLGGVTYLEWLTDGRCERTDSQIKGLGFDSYEAMEIHDFLDAALESIE